MSGPSYDTTKETVNNKNDPPEGYCLLTIFFFFELMIFYGGCIAIAIVRSLLPELYCESS